MSENRIVAGKPLLSAVMKKENDSESFAIVKYEKVDSTYYSFSYSFDDDYEFRMDETEQSAEHTEYVEAEFIDDVSESDKVYYAVAAASGILTGMLSKFHLTEEQIKDIDEFKEKNWKPLVIGAANLIGYKKNDYKGASKYLVRRAVRTIEKNEKAKEYLCVLAEHPSLAGLLFSIITQFNKKLIVLNENGEISKCKLPDYYVIGDSNAEKLVCAVFYWLFSIAANEAESKRRVIDELGIPKDLIKKIKEFANISFMKNILSNYEEAEKVFSEWLEKTIKDAELYDGQKKDTVKIHPLFAMMGIALNLAEDSFPVLINELSILRKQRLLKRSRSGWILGRVLFLMESGFLPSLPLNTLLKMRTFCTMEYISLQRIKVIGDGSICSRKSWHYLNHILL